MSSIKALYLFVTNEAEESQAIDSFIGGYEDDGSTWDGTIDYLENISNDDITLAFITEKIANGYNLFIRNTAPGSVANQGAVYDYAKENGALFVTPVGSNARTEIDTFSGYYSLVTCGSGLPEVGNATAYPCVFFDNSVATENNGNVILNMNQCGTTYNLSHIQRRSSTVLSFKIEGLTTLEGTGISDHGIPLFFDSLTGSDISPLPTGGKFTTFADESGIFFFVSHSTTAGTINTGFGASDYQALTGGTVTFGSLDTSQVFIRMADYIPLTISGLGITIQGVTGFENDVNGFHPVSIAINQDGFGDKTYIQFDLGSGELTSSDGKLYYITQSYSTPRIAGKLARIKDVNDCSWGEAIGRGIQSTGVSYDEHNGYGVIQSVPAQDSLLYVYLDTPELTLTEPSSTTVRLTYTEVLFADYYEVYFRDELFDTIPAQVLTVLYSVSEIGRHTRGRKNLFKVRAVTEAGLVGEFSNEEEFVYYYSAGFMYLGTVPNIGTFSGYGFDYGQNYGDIH